MKKYFIILCVFALCVIASVAISVTITKGLIGKQDLSLWDGTATKTFTRTTEDGYTLTLNQFDWVGVDVLQKYGGGVSYTLTTINSALTAVGAVNNVALWFAPGTWTITDDVTITSNITMVVPPGVSFSITAGKTMTIQGPIQAGPYQIFSGSGTATYTAAPGILWGEWESGGTSGATIGDYLTLPAGNSIAEFSTDGTMAGNSDTAVPTEKAVRTYVGSGWGEGFLVRPKFEWAETLYFNSGGTTEISVGDTIVGATSAKEAYVEVVNLQSGTWAGGDAEGVLFLTLVTGAFQSENLNISGGASNVATITGDTEHNGITMTPGSYHMAGALQSYSSVNWKSKLGFEFGPNGSSSGSDALGNNQWHVLYINSSAVTTLGSSTITCAEFINTDEVSSWVTTTNGYYPASNGTYAATVDRAIFAVLTDGSGNIIEWSNDGSRYVQFDVRQADITDQDIDTAWVDAEAALTMPSFSTKAVIYVQWENETTDNWYLAIRRNGSPSTNGHVFFYMGTAAANVGRGFHATVHTDSSQLIEFKSSATADDQIDAWTIGWFLPAGM